MNESIEVTDATDTAVNSANDSRSALDTAPGVLPRLGEVSKEDLFEAIEASLREEGLLEPKFRTCFGCDASGFDLAHFEGFHLDATACETCREEADKIDELVSERGRKMVRRVRVRPRNHAVFLEQDEVWLVTPDEVRKLPCVPPFGSDDEVRERLDIYEVFS